MPGASNTIRWALTRRLLARLRVRFVDDAATTSGDATITSATALFTVVDEGRPVAGTNIPVGTTIASVTSATSAELSANATGTGTGTLTIGRSGLYVADAVTTTGSPTITSATAVFLDDDVGKPITGAGIPDFTRILSVTNTTTAVLDANATASATGVTVRVGTGLDQVLFEPGWPGDRATDELVWVDELAGDITYPVMVAGRRHRDDKFTIPLEVRVAGKPTLDLTKCRLAEIVAAIEDEFADDLSVDGFVGLIEALVESVRMTAGEIDGCLGFGEITVACHARYE